MKLAAAVLASLTIVAAAGAANGDPKKKIIPAVQAHARAINFHLSDLPPLGWATKPASPRSSTPRCSGYNPKQSDLTENADADSPTFTLPNGSFIASTVGIFVTAKQGRTAYGRIVQPKLPICLGEIFRKGTGVPTTIVSTAQVSFPNLADRTDEFRVVADVSAGSQRIRVTIDLVTMNRGKTDVALFFAAIGKSFTPALELSLARKVAARLP